MYESKPHYTHQAEIERLQRENAKLVADYDLRTDQLNAEVRWRVRLEAKLAAAEAALRVYGKHSMECPCSYNVRNPKCDCGLNAASTPRKRRLGK